MENKKKMYFQYIQGPKQGTVVCLSKIIKDEDEFGQPVTYLLFNDGERCDIQLIAPINDTTAYNKGNFYMVRLYSPENKWTFQKLDMHDEKRQAIGGPDNDQLFEGANPYAITGKQQTMKCVSIPPKIVVWKNDRTSLAKAKASNLNSFRINPGGVTAIMEMNRHMNQMINPQDAASGSLSIDLQHNKVSAPTAADLARFGIQNVSTGILLSDTPVPTGILDDEETAAIQTGPVTAQIEEPQKDDSDVLKSKKISSEKPLTETEVVKVNVKNADEMSEINHDLPVTPGSPVISIIDKCKKKEVDIPVNLKVNIPGKGIYEFIKDNFGDNEIHNFLNSVVNDIMSQLDLREMLKNSLNESYSTQENTSEK